MSNYNYGAIDSSPACLQTTHPTPHDGRAAEHEDGLALGAKGPSRLSRHFTASVSAKHGDLALLFCYPITGLLDSAAVYTWGSFVSMQTGNTVYLGAGLVSPTTSTRWIRALTAILSFCLGAYCFSHYHRHFGSRKRWVLVCSYAIQLVFVTIAAMLVTVGPRMSPDGPVTAWVIVPLALLGFQSAGQAVMSRVLEHGSLTSVVLTSIYCDLFSDQRLFAGITANAERNRRAAAPILLVLGAVVGALWDKTSVGLTGALWTAVGMKAIVVLLWLFWANEKEESE